MFSALVTCPAALNFRVSHPSICCNRIGSRSVPCDLKYSRACTDAFRFAAPTEEPCPTPTFTPLTIVRSTLKKQMRCSITKAVLTDGSDVIHDVVFGPLFRRAPLEVFGQTPPRHFLQEVVEITNRVRCARNWHLRICKNSARRKRTPHGEMGTHRCLRIQENGGGGHNENFWHSSQRFKYSSNTPRMSLNYAQFIMSPADGSRSKRHHIDTRS
jgi:hypothetical protein